VTPGAEPGVKGTLTSPSIWRQLLALSARNMSPIRSSCLRSMRAKTSRSVCPLCSMYCSESVALASSALSRLVIVR